MADHEQRKQVPKQTSACAPGTATNDPSADYHLDVGMNFLRRIISEAYNSVDSTDKTQDEKDSLRLEFDQLYNRERMTINDIEHLQGLVRQVQPEACANEVNQELQAVIKKKWDNMER
jgi:hypothetical protein